MNTTVQLWNNFKFIVKATIISLVTIYGISTIILILAY